MTSAMELLLHLRTGATIGDVRGCAGGCAPWRRTTPGRTKARGRGKRAWEGTKAHPEEVGEDGEAWGGRRWPETSSPMVNCAEGGAKFASLRPSRLEWLTEEGQGSTAELLGVSPRLGEARNGDNRRWPWNLGLG